MRDTCRARKYFHPSNSQKEPKLSWFFHHDFPSHIFVQPLPQFKSTLFGSTKTDSFSLRPLGADHFIPSRRVTMLTTRLTESSVGSSMPSTKRLLPLRHFFIFATEPSFLLDCLGTVQERVQNIVYVVCNSQRQTTTEYEYKRTTWAMLVHTRHQVDANHSFFPSHQ